MRQNFEGHRSQSAESGPSTHSTADQEDPFTQGEWLISLYAPTCFYMPCILLSSVLVPACCQLLACDLVSLRSSVVFPATCSHMPCILWSSVVFCARCWHMQCLMVSSVRY